MTAPAEVLVSDEIDAPAAVGEQRARIDWSSTYEPSADADQVKGLIEGIYTGGISGLKCRFGMNIASTPRSTAIA